MHSIRFSKLPADVVPGEDEIKVGDDSGVAVWQKVSAVYKLGSKIAIEVPGQMLQCDPEVKIIVRIQEKRS